MAQVLTLTRDDPVIYLKAYGGVQINGTERTEVVCEIDAPQLATLVEEDGHVHVTVNAGCRLQVPRNASISVERSMGSVKVETISGKISVEKVMGNLVLIDVAEASVGKVGGNFSVHTASGAIMVEKVAGSLTIDDVFSFSGEKVGGNCILRNVQQDCRIEKAGGQCLAQGLKGQVELGKFGGSLKARELALGFDVKVGGDIELVGCSIERDLGLSAGGNVAIAFPDGQENLALKMRSAGQRIKIRAFGEEIDAKSGLYDYVIGEGDKTVTINAGGTISIADAPKAGEDLIGDLSDRFTFEESAFSEMIQERIDSATRRAEAKVRAAEIRLGQIQDRVEKRRGINIDVDFNDQGIGVTPTKPGTPIPPISRPAGKKGATDEERLMILKMLQDGKISVDEAETLFKAMEGGGC